MNNSDFDDAVTKIILEINALQEKMLTIFPKGNDHILKHFAASAIHLSLFMRDYTAIALDKKVHKGKKEDEFLDKCGCDFNKG